MTRSDHPWSYRRRYRLLPRSERPIDEAEIHLAWLTREVQGVTFAPAAKTISALEEFVAYANAAN